MPSVNIEVKAVQEIIFEVKMFEAAIKIGLSGICLKTERGCSSKGNRKE